VQSFDFAVLNFIYYNFRCGILDVLMPIVSALGNDGMVWIVLAIVLLIIRRYREAGVALCFALALDLIVCNLVLKPLVGRIRPYDVNTAIQLLITSPTDYSFPSGHTAASFTAVSALYFSHRKKLWKPALVLAVLIAFSRLYLYVHYPSDVLAGAVIGTFIGYLGCRAAGALLDLWKRRRKPK